MYLIMIKVIAIILLFATPCVGKPLGEFERDYSPQTSFAYKEDAPYTAWNKFWLGAAIGSQFADVGSSYYQINGSENCVEANPLFGEDPNYIAMFLVKAAILGVTYWYVENVTVETQEQRQSLRNWAYAPHAIIGTAVTAHNMSLDCR